MNTHEPTGPSGFALPGLGIGPEMGAGVASLDSPLVQQTKSEIRSLAAEIAKLAHSPISAEDFYDGFLPRLCVAMGASAAAVWEVRLPSEVVLRASHALPPQLVNENHPSETHTSILQCVIAEGQPVLVPPGGVTVDANRPSNPLSDALVVIPVRIQENVDYVLEVVQRQSGGPAAQRGYLRFVAQMADLMADYLRRQQLREFASKELRLSRIEDCLLRIAGSRQIATRALVAADSLAELLGADYALVVQGNKRPKVRAISGTNAPDPRSEVVLGARALIRSVARDGSAGVAWYHATDRRDVSGDAHHVDESGSQHEIQRWVDTLCDVLRSRRLLCLSIDEPSETRALIAYAGSCPTQEQTDLRWESDTVKLAESIGSLLATDYRSPPPWLAWLPFAHRRTRETKSRTDIMLCWVARVAICGLLIAVALFPVPQQIVTTAILQPVNKRIYYAPMDGEVTAIHVAEGEVVDREQLLIELTSRDLDEKISQLTERITSSTAQLEGVSSRLDRGRDFVGGQRADAETKKKLLEAALPSLHRQIERLNVEKRKLKIRAQETGRIATRKLNSLQGKPVAVGEPLVVCFDPDGLWKLQLHISDFRVGTVMDAIDAGETVRVRFALSSHPDHLNEARLTKLASHATPAEASADSMRKIVLAEAAVDASALPMKMDGAIARATIECGRVPAIWLVFRDAYRAVSSRVQMIW